MRLPAGEVISTALKGRSTLDELDRALAREDERAGLVPAAREAMPACREASRERGDAEPAQRLAVLDRQVGVERHAMAVHEELEPRLLVPRPGSLGVALPRFGDEAVADPERSAGGHDRRRRGAGEDVEPGSGARRLFLRGSGEDDEGCHWFSSLTSGVAVF